MKITFNHVKHVITFTNLAPPNRSEPSQLDWPRTVLRHFEAFITAPHLRCSVHGKRADTVALGSGVDFSKLFEKYPLPKKREKFPEIMPTFKTLWTHKQQKS